MTALLVAAGIASFITTYTAKDVALTRMGTACRRAMPNAEGFVDEAEAASVLSEVASVAETREGRVRVQASTASYPWNPEYAQALSQERASAAADALVSLGVEAGRIDVEGLGFGGPNYIEDIDPETGLQIPSAATRNRRVTITIE